MYDLYATHCVQHSQGAQIPKQLEWYKFDKILQKGVDQDDDCLSAFASFGKRRDTGLAGYLRQHNVQQLYILGVTLEQCIKETVQDSIKSGFETYVIADACAPVAASSEEETLQQMQLLGAKLTLAADVMKSA